MKYKIGDKVLVRPDLEENKTYGNEVVISDMLYFKGKIVTIEHVDYPNHYRIKEDPDEWFWTDEMFLPNTKYNIGDKVRVREDLIEYEKYKDILFVPSMNSFKGKIVTIYDFTDRGYRIEEDYKRYRWTDNMFSGKVSEEIKSEYLSDLEEIEEHFDYDKIYNPSDEFPVSIKESTSNFIIVKSNRLKLLL